MIISLGWTTWETKEMHKMSKQTRPVIDLIEPIYVLEGAGVRLRRSMATRRLDYLDPFLLFDHFGSDDPDDYLAGFPMHPHRGIETVTYMLAGKVHHADSLGNSGDITSGDVQWMTSGRGIMHEEMPQPVNGKMEGFQLWVNLPARLKMTRPRYQEVLSSNIPMIELESGAHIRLIAGQIGEILGPVTEIAADPAYLDVTLASDGRFEQPIPRGHTAFAYVFEGQGNFAGSEVTATHLVIFGEGDQVQANTGLSGMRFLLVSGQPLEEPIARYGPFVMNTRQEIEQALSDLHDGTFVQP
jgi:redox-sensitive bicupin YhaK (pirin superfamily)